MPRIVWLAAACVLLAGLAGAVWFFVAQDAGYQKDKKTALGLFNSGKLAEARPLLADLTKRSPSDVEVVRALALSQRAGKPLVTLALPYFDQWCELAPADVNAYLSRMRLHMLVNNREKALSDGLKVLELTPNNAPMRRTVASLATQTGKFELAEQQCKLCLKNDPNDDYVHYLLAKNYQTQGKLNEMDKVALDILKRNATNAVGNLLRGIRLYEQDKFAVAVPHLRYAAAGNLANIDLRASAYLHLHLALARTGKTAQANAALARFKTIKLACHHQTVAISQPAAYELNLLAAKQLLNIDLPHDALTHGQRILRLRPNDAEALSLMADIHQQLGDALKAREFRRRAAALP